MQNPRVPATLASLHIRNLALVKSLDWELGPGFTAVTGETGSGKSIILGALKLVLGERADKSMLRTGADACSVEAVFQVGDTAALDARLAEAGIEPCTDGVLLIKRAFTASGTNRQWVNACATTLPVLKMLGDDLVDLHGPHDHQSLLSAETQRDLLDAFAGAAGARDAYRHAYGAWSAAVAEREALSGSGWGLDGEMDLLRHQVAEIEGAGLSPDEEEPLLARYRVASNSRRLVELAGGIVAALEEGEAAALPVLAEAQKLWRELAALDPSMAGAAGALAEAVAALEDAARDVRRYRDRLDPDPELLRKLEERMDTIESLKRKYGGSVESVLAFGEAAAGRLRKMASRGEELERLAAEIVRLEGEVRKAGKAWSELRGAAAPRLAAAIAGGLKDLGFPSPGFDVALWPCARPSAFGMETVEFLFAPNPGEPFKPLKAVASSGEISRVMLAVKAALAEQDRTALMVFDEIDANVGGEIAHAVADRMREIGKRHQVLTITHLPQVAAAAARQFVVSKRVESGRTVSRLDLVEGEARVAEIARMLGGRTASVMVHAAELLGASRG